MESDKGNIVINEGTSLLNRNQKIVNESPKRSHKNVQVKIGDYNSIGVEESLESSEDDMILEKKSYLPVLLLYILYGVSFSLLIPALPGLALDLVDGNAVRSAMIFGTATSVRYGIEFFSAPILGTLADSKGRKIVFALAFFISAIEFFLLCFYPSITMIFITRAMSGAMDAGVATAYAMITDIAMFNNDIVSQQFGLLAAMFGLAFIIGPIAGGYLAQVNMSACFFISACLSLLGALLCCVYLEETKEFRSRAHSRCDEINNEVLLKEEPHPLNPIAGLRIHFSNPKLKRLSIPLALCSVNTGLSFMWYLYMKYRFNSNSAHIGFYLSFHGFMNAIAQGIMIKILIPKYITEKMALFYGLILSAVQTFLNGICSSEWELYIVSVVFFLGIIHFPAIKAIIVNESIKTKQGSNYQANLQGAISSIRTASMSVGSLLFSSLFSIGISMKPYPIPSLPFIAGSLIYLAAYLYLQSDSAAEIEDVEEKNVGFTLNVAEGGLGGEEPEFFQ